jgi:hypothetical protein
LLWGDLIVKVNVEPKADYKLTEHVALRFIQVEYLCTHYGGNKQNDARIESGIVYRCIQSTCTSSFCNFFF